MAIKFILPRPNLKKFLSKFTDSLIEDQVKERVNVELSKVRAVDIMRLSPTYLGNYPEGAKRKVYPLGVDFSTLRDFATFYPIARACIEFRKSQITQLAWNIIPKELTKKAIEDKKNIDRSQIMMKFFKHPTGKRESSFSDWLKQILEDLMVIDAVAIYKKRNRGGEIIGYLPIDGATIEIFLEQDGTIPDPPAPAYLQKVNGQEINKLTKEELIYMVMNPRTYSPFGISPIENLIVTITTALKLQAYSLATLTEGNVPDGFVELPKDVASSRDQVKEWQDAWDAMLSGDPRFQHKLKFLPGGMKYTATRTTDDMSFERFEKWLLLNTCSVFGVQPNAIGFNFETNRSTSETAYEVGKERGMLPLALWVKEMMDEIVQEDFGWEDLEFNWTNLNPTNKLEEMKVAKDAITTGMMSIDEWRIGENLKPIGVDEPFIQGPLGAVFVKGLFKQYKEGEVAVMPYKPPAEATVDNTGAEAVVTPNVPSQQKADNVEIIKELRRWRKASINDWKLNKEPRFFKTDIVDLRTQQLIRSQLKKAKTKEEIEKVFLGFISSQNKFISPLFKLYEDINQLITNRKTENSFVQPVVVG